MLQNLSTDTPTDAQCLAFLKELQTQGFIVENSINEGERYLGYLNQSTSQPGGELNVTLLTNLQRCPLACSYCYQKGTHTGERLAGDLSEECLEFIKKQCLKLGVERLFISYYGSEPLSNPKAILSTATELQGFCRERGIQFRFGMVTNGVLLTRKIVEKLLPLGFVQAQITIDGNQETHDASRPFQSGKGTYSTIMRNLSQYAGLIHTTVLCVLDESRIDATYELIDTLAGEGYPQRQVEMTFSPVVPTYDNETVEAAQLSMDKMQMMRAEKKSPLKLRSSRSMRQRGDYTTISVRNTHGAPCSAMMDGILPWIPRERSIPVRRLSVGIKNMRRGISPGRLVGLIWFSRSSTSVQSSVSLARTSLSAPIAAPMPSIKPERLPRQTQKKRSMIVLCLCWSRHTMNPLKLMQVDRFC